MYKIMYNENRALRALLIDYCTYTLASSALLSAVNWKSEEARY
jgi:hypothetical protein